MRTLSLLLLLVISTICKAQFKIIGGQISLSPPKYRAVLKDSSEIIVSYAASEVPDVKNPARVSHASTILLLGKNFSKFIDAGRLKLDSLEQIFSKKDKVGTADLNISFKYLPIFLKTVLADRVNNTLSIRQNFKDRYQYTEPAPKFNWILLKGTEKILGYACNTAELDFRGRKWKAWYAPELAFSSGPYIFGGLPGLILKMEDEGHEFSFVATGIEKAKKEIIWRTEDDIKTISREDFRKLEKNYHSNPGFFITAKAYDPDGKEITPNFKARPFNPIDRD